MKKITIAHAMIVSVAASAAVSTRLPILTAPMTPEEKEAAMNRRLSESAAKTLVANEFKDPDSALFRKMRRKDQWSWCGEINAKNAYGGYVGYRAFFVTAYFDPPVLLMRDPRAFTDLSQAPGCDSGDP